MHSVNRFGFKELYFSDAMGYSGVQLGGHTEVYLPCEVWIYSLSLVRWNVAVSNGCKLATSFSALDNNSLSKRP